MSGTQFTTDAYERLRAELEGLRTKGRIEIAQQIEAARALGDLSENGDYHAAKDSQGKMEARIRQLEGLMKGATIVQTASDGTVSAGSVVGIRFDGDDDVERYLVGSIEEKREGVSIVSPGSPLGQALLGHRAGDTVAYEAPNGARLEATIVEVGA